MASSGMVRNFQLGCISLSFVAFSVFIAPLHEQFKLAAKIAFCVAVGACGCLAVSGFASLAGAYFSIFDDPIATQNFASFELAEFDVV